MSLMLIVVWMLFALTVRPLTAAEDRMFVPMENADISVMVDAEAGATIRSSVQKHTGQEFTFADRADGHLTEFHIVDEWPGPTAGSFVLIAERRDIRGHELVFRRTVPGWTRTRTFALPPNGTRLEVRVDIMNTGDRPREIVPLMLDRVRPGNAHMDDHAAIFCAESDRPVRTISFSENFWIVPARGWFGVAGDASANALWITTPFDQLNAILVQGPYHVSYPWWPNRPILGWCYAPVVLAPGVSWSTTCTYACARGLPALTSCSADFAAHMAQQHFATAPDSLAIQLAAAPTESAQLMVRNTTRNEITARIHVDDLASVDQRAQLAADHVRLFLQHYVPCNAVSDIVRGAVGEWPDPLTPVTGAIVLPAERTTGLWMDVEVPRDAPAGIYDGSVTIALEGGASHALPLRLHVANVTLPVRSFLRGDMGSGNPAANRIMLAHRQQPRSLGGAIPQTADGYDFRAHDLELDALLEMGMNTFGLQLKDHIVHHLKERELLDMAVLYTHDEPGERRDLAWRREQYEDPHEMDHGVAVMATVHPYEFAEGTIDVWVPVSNNFSPPMGRRMQARNDEVWWYVCCGPKWPFANYFIDYPSIDHRAFYWQTYALGIQGVLYWGAHYVHQDQNPWQNPLGLVGNANGDGYLLYPHDGGYVPSLRLKILRDGVEDYDLLTLLEQTAAVSSDPERLRAARQLLTLDELTRGPRTYSRDPRRYLDHRRQVIGLLEAISSEE